MVYVSLSASAWHLHLFKAHSGQQWTHRCSLSRRTEFGLELVLVFNLEGINYKRRETLVPPSLLLRESNADLHASDVGCLFP